MSDSSRATLSSGISEKKSSLKRLSDFILRKNWSGSKSNGRPKNGGVKVDSSNTSSPLSSSLSSVSEKNPTHHKGLTINESRGSPNTNLPSKNSHRDDYSQDAPLSKKGFSASNGNVFSDADPPKKHLSISIDNDSSHANLPKKRFSVSNDYDSSDTSRRKASFPIINYIDSSDALLPKKILQRNYSEDSTENYLEKGFFSSDDNDSSLSEKDERESVSDANPTKSETAVSSSDSEFDGIVPSSKISRTRTKPRVPVRSHSRSRTVASHTGGRRSTKYTSNDKHDDHRKKHPVPVDTQTQTLDSYSTNLNLESSSSLNNVDLGKYESGKVQSHRNSFSQTQTLDSHSANLNIESSSSFNNVDLGKYESGKVQSHRNSFSQTQTLDSNSTHLNLESSSSLNNADLGKYDSGKVQSDRKSFFVEDSFSNSGEESSDIDRSLAQPPYLPCANDGLQINKLSLYDSLTVSSNEPDPQTRHTQASSFGHSSTLLGSSFISERVPDSSRQSMYSRRPTGYFRQSTLSNDPLYYNQPVVPTSMSGVYPEQPGVARLNVGSYSPCNMSSSIRYVSESRSHNSVCSESAGELIPPPIQGTWRQLNHYSNYSGYEGCSAFEKSRRCQFNTYGVGINIPCLCEEKQNYRYTCNDEHDADASFQNITDISTNILRPPSGLAVVKGIINSTFSGFGLGGAGLSTSESRMSKNH